MLKMNQSVKMIVTLVVIAVVVAAALAGVNILTKDKIAQNDESKLQNSLKEVLPADTYEVLKKTDEFTVYQAVKNDEQIGYCVQNSVSGYGGAIQMLVGMDKEFKVTKITILSHGETPGLGANATKDNFKKQFEGKQAGDLRVDKNSSGETKIKAISGATITSTAVTDAVNAAKKCVEEATK